MKHGEKHHDNWGPIADLASLLASSVAVWHKHPEFWLTTAERFSGLWGLYSSECWIRYDPTHAEVSLPNPSFWRQLSFLFWRLWHREHKFPTHPQLPDPDALAKTLVRCHSWLADMLMRHTARLFMPPCDRPPYELCMVSQKAIAWALIVYVCDTMGPGMLVSDNNFVILPKQYHLTEQDLVGDHLALHTLIEVLAQRVFSGAENVSSTHTFLLGGLRTQAFLESYCGLANDITEEVDPWRNALDKLIRHSPLTQLVYLDILDLPLNPQLARGLARPRKSETETLWYDVWVSQLARSLIGVLKSLAHAARQRALLDTEISRLEAQLSLDGVKSASWNFGLTSQLKYLTNRRKKLNDCVLPHYLSRIGFWADLFQHNPWASYLHIRMLDMLVRDIFAGSVGAMRRQWRNFGCGDEGHRAHLCFIRDRITPHKQKEHGVCYLKFVRQLFHCDWIEDLDSYAVKIAEFQNYTCSQLQDQIKILLEPALTHRVNSSNRFKDLIASFSGKQPHGIRLPCRYPDDRALPPSEILKHWSNALFNRLSTLERTES